MDVLLRMDYQGDVPSVGMYKHLLQTCIQHKSLTDAKHVHSHLVKHGLETNGMLGEAVVNALVQCGSLVDGLQVFQRLVRPTVFVWTALMSGYVKASRCREALMMYQKMREQGVHPNTYTFVILLKACGSLEDLKEGKRIHADIVKLGFESDVFVGTTLVDMYSKCNSIQDARHVFDRLSERNVVSWNAMLAAYARLDQGEDALQLYSQMQLAGVTPDDRTFVSMIQACGSIAEKEESSLVDDVPMKAKSLYEGKSLHAEAALRGYESDVFVGTALVSLYAKCGSIAEAQHVFDGLPQRNVVLWSAMLAAYAQQDQGERCLQLYSQMQEVGVSPDARTFVSLLQACGSLADNEEESLLDGFSIKLHSLQKGKAVHAEAAHRGYDSSVFVGSTLVSIYAKCGSIRDAEGVFEKLSVRNVVSWNAMLAAYAQQDQGNQAFQLYRRMQEEHAAPDAWTFASLLQACGSLAEQGESTLVNGEAVKLESLWKGKALHAEARRRGFESNAFIGSSLVSMYAKCGSTVDAGDVFDKLPHQDVVSWTALLAGYVQQDEEEKALQLYSKMEQEGVPSNSRTFVSMLQACASLADKEEPIMVDGQLLKPKSLQKGKALHAELLVRGYESDVFVSNALVCMYAKCGSSLHAQQVFDRLPKVDVKAWTAMLAQYVHQDQAETGLSMYVQMQEQGIQPNEISFIVMLQACSNIGALNNCIAIHQDISESGLLGCPPSLATALIHAYGKCGSMWHAQQVFDSLTQQNLWSCTALMAGYARQGDCESSVQLYEDLCMSGLKPDAVTFLSLLSACNHAGMVDKGLEFFGYMTTHHGITPAMEHYVTLIDLVSRAGLFSKAEELLLGMPMQPSLPVWLCLLGACRKHGNIELGRRAFDWAVHLQPQEGAAYVLMSNIYAHAGKWDDAKKIDEARRKAGAWKKPAQSWIEHGHEVHTFSVADCEHDQSETLFLVLRELKDLLHKGDLDIGR